MSEESRLVLIGVTGDVQQMYVGTVNRKKSVLLENVQQGAPITITNARILLNSMLHMMSPNGPVLNMSSKVISFPMCSDSAGVTVEVKAITVIELDENPTLKKSIEELIEECKQMEAQQRAKESGIVTASTMPAPPRLKLT